MSFSIPNTPMGQSDKSLGDLGAAHGKTIKNSNVSGAGVDDDDDSSATLTQPRSPLAIKGRLGAHRKKKGVKKAQDDATDEEWMKSVVNDAPTKPIKKSVFGDAAIEAAIAAVTKPNLRVQIPTAKDSELPSTSSPSHQNQRVWPGIAIPYETEEEGDTQRIESKNNKRSRPSTRDSLGSLSRLSVNNSIADLSIEKMSLTNSAKSLSLEDSDWDLLASINQRMNGITPPEKSEVVVDPVAFNARVNSNMQMSELMKVGWELRPQALGGKNARTTKWGHASRGGSAGSSTGSTNGGNFSLSLGLSGVIKTKTKSKKEDPPIVERPKAMELTIDGKYLDNIPRKPTKPATTKKAGGSSGRNRGRKVKRTESPIKKQKRGGENNNTATATTTTIVGDAWTGDREYVNYFDNGGRGAGSPNAALLQNIGRKYIGMQ